MKLDKRKSQKKLDINSSGPFEARVVNVLDPLYSGSIEVELLRTSETGGDGGTGQTVVCRYLHPFYGATSVRGLSKNDSYGGTQQSYGMWFVPPDVGNRVLVMFVEGNINRAFWIGCVQQTTMNFMLPDGRPATTNTDTEDASLSGKKLPVGEHNKLRVEGQTISNPLSIKKPINMLFKAVLDNQGLTEDETRGLTTTSARREVPSSVFGISTPGPLDKTATKSDTFLTARLGGTSIVMDDGDEKFIRKTSAATGKYEYINVATDEPVTEGDENTPHNELFRIRTRTGHQILLHNSEDLVYIANANGSAWIEMTASGKIDFFANDSVSVHSKGDFNFKTDRDFNLEANRNINLKADTINTEVATENLKVTGTQTNDIGATQNTTVGSDSNLYAGSNVNIDVGGLVNIANGVFSGAPISELSTFQNPGENTDSIMKRIPQHEPWAHHENYDPIAVAVAKTDRNVDEQIVVAEPVNIPDTFKSGRT